MDPPRSPSRPLPHYKKQMPDTWSDVLFLVPGRGLEPPRPYGLIHLKDKCLPISTPGHLLVKSRDLRDQRLSPTIANIFLIFKFRQGRPSGKTDYSLFTSTGSLFARTSASASASSLLSSVMPPPTTRARRSCRRASRATFSRMK